MGTSGSEMMHARSLVAMAATATVTLVVEIDVGTWGHDCTVGQAAAQAKDDAVKQIQRALASLKNARLVRAETVRVVCEAKGRR
jgi:hypothetical protein